ncbi:MAG: alpha/beta hydrolase [Oscillospiraceae bacterium]|jgi:acetyl esterase/lipase|nr:alpha/beta hydrolase [Oscillospiraceae bacterium]
MLYRHNSSPFGRTATSALSIYSYLSNDRASRFREDVYGIPQFVSKFINVRSRHVLVSGVPCTWYIPEDAPDNRAVLYLHGGAYVGGRSTLPFESSVIAARLRLRVLAVDYRLAPEHPYPAALTDALAAYSSLFSEGYQSERIAVIGDSAGGGLALALTELLRDKQMPLPSSLTMLSPWLDLRCDEGEYKSFTRDPLLVASSLRESAVYYSRAAERSDRYISPLFGSAANLPPTLIIAGERELLLTDSVRFSQKLSEAGSPFELHLWRDMFHVFPITAPFLPESKEAFSVAQEYISSHFQ